MNTSKFNEGFLGRILGGWNDFFFKPGDPTTLGLMRIIVGVLVVYVHLAYTHDLIEFFGPAGWADSRLSDSVRKESPVQIGPLEWDEPTTNFVPPIDREYRRAFFRWVMTLPATSDQRRETLAYLEGLPLEPRSAIEGLAFAEQFLFKAADGNPRQNLDQLEPVGKEEYDYRMSVLKRDHLGAAEKQMLPQFMASMLGEERRNIATKLERFLGSLPRDRHDTPIILRTCNTRRCRRSA